MASPTRNLLVLVVLAMALGCKAGRGESCNVPKDCGKGLTCVDSKCVSHEAFEHKKAFDPGVLMTTEPSEAAAMLIISKSAIVLGEEPEPVVKLPPRDELAKTGLPAEHKRTGADDRFIVPLAKRLAAVRKAEQAERQAKGLPLTTSEAIVVADADTPYRLLLEVLYTLGQSEFGRYYLMVMKPHDQSAPAPQAEPKDISSEPRIEALRGKPIGLSVTITDQGIAMGSKQGPIAADCRELGPGLTVPKRDGEHDWVALATCVARLDREAPKEDAVNVSAQNHTRFQTVIHVIDVLRGPKGKSHFPSVEFAPPR